MFYSLDQLKSNILLRNFTRSNTASTQGRKLPTAVENYRTNFRIQSILKSHKGQGHMSDRLVNVSPCLFLVTKIVNFQINSC